MPTCFDVTGLVMGTSGKLTMDTVINFPHLIPIDTEGLHYEGYLTICAQRFHLEVCLPPSRKLCEAEVRCDWMLQQVLGPFRPIIHQRLSQCTSLVSFLKEVQSIAERQLEGCQESIESSSKLCSQLIAHIDFLGWNKLVHVDKTFSQLHLQVTDAGDRNHVIKLLIGEKYPIDCPKYSVDLPNKFDLFWTQESSLQDVYDQFRHTLDQYQDFWEQLASIDAQTWVLEPEKPTFSARHRRIAISTSSSVQVTLDPHNPSALPECKFLGSDHAIAPIRSNMNANIQIWDEDKNLLENLQILLGITFPSPSNTKKEEFNAECGICYSYRIESEIPDEVCNDSRCHQAFHKSCLVEWLRALSTSRQSFNTIFGNCPYCEKPITVKMVMK